MAVCRIRLICLVGAGITLLFAADPAWKNKPPSQWTSEDAAQILTKSPWARQVLAGVARRQSEDELRDGGQMGQPKGLGYDDVDPKGSGPRMPKPSDFIIPGNDRSARSMVSSMQVRIRWETALPVRLAELRSQESGPPTLEGEGYRIAVYGLPGTNIKGDPKKLGDPLKDEAFLRREGKKDVKPTSVEVFRLGDGYAAVYVFPLSAEISPKDGRLEFEAHIGRIVVAQSFDLSEMIFQGKLEL